MIQKLKQPLLIIASLAVLFAPAFMPAVASADTTPGLTQIQSNLCGGVNNLQLGSTGSCDGNGSQDTFNKIITTAVNVFSVVVGIVAVIMIIVGGFKYITSGGESNNVSSAKNTILFAIVGLIIVGLAQVIVHFVVGHVAGVGSGQ